jgi:DNA repair exonuclease SbcCD ATPase subunit
MKRQLTMTTAIAIFTASLLASCSESKQVQCDKLIAQTNKVDSLLEEIPKKLQEIFRSDPPKTPQDLDKIKAITVKIADLFKTTSNDLSKIDGEIQGIKLSDEKLKQEEAKYTENLKILENGFKSTEEVTRKASEAKTIAEFQAIEKNVSPETLKTQQQIPVAISETKTIGTQIKTYCNSQNNASPTASPPATPTTPLSSPNSPPATSTPPPSSPK